MKKIRNILLLLILAAAAWFGYKWFFKKADSMGSFQLVPSDAVFVVETDNAIESWKTFSSSSFWKHLKNYGPLGDIGKIADAVDNLLQQNKLMATAFGKRHALISAHVINKRDYDFLYILDISGASSVSVFESGLETLLKQQGFAYDKAEYKGTKVHSFQDPKDKSVLSIAIKGDKLLCSYKFGLVMRGLGATEEPSILDNPKFKQVVNETPNGNSCKLYLNYNYAADFMGVYSDDVETMRPIFNAMEYTGLAASVNEEMVELTGFTNIKDSSVGYLQALAKSGNSDMHVQAVMPRNVSFFMRMGFDNFGRFRNNLLETLEENPMEKTEFKRTQKLVEGYLGISLDDDLLGWVDNEIAVAQFQQNRFIANKVNNAIFVRTKSEQLASEKFDKIEKRISNRTPIKINVGEYKGHKIRMLGLKGIFKLFFGKAFDKVEKPYFTNVGDYMVFADDPKTLLNIVDNYENRTTLDEQDDFANFKDGFSFTSNVFAYVNMPRFVPNMQAILQPSSWAEMENNTQYVMYFKHMGFELEYQANDNMFKTRLCTFYEVPNEQTMEIRNDLPEEFDEETIGDSLSAADEFLISTVYGETYKEFYASGQVKFEASRKNGQLHGRYKEYYEDGTLKTEGKYRNGEKHGKWRYYRPDGEEERTENHGGILDAIRDELGI